MAPPPPTPLHPLKQCKRTAAWRDRFLFQKTVIQVLNLVSKHLIWFFSPDWPLELLRSSSMLERQATHDISTLTPHKNYNAQQDGLYLIKTLRALLARRGKASASLPQGRQNFSKKTRLLYVSC